MKIVYLADHPDHIPELAELHFAEWRHLGPGKSLADKVEYLRRICGRNGVPSAVIAVEGAQLIGSASLVAHDMDSRPELTPWLADVYVKAEHRGQGIGTSLIQRIEAEAKAAGITRLYLYTPDAADWYRRLGWVSVESCKYNGVDVVVMTRTIKQASAPE